MTPDLEFLSSSRGAIASFLRDFLSAKEALLASVPRWGHDALERLASFSLSGKMTRGALLLLGHGMYSGKRADQALRCAAGMELVQAGFLVHDDIMDRDRTRRGSPSLHWQYASLAESEGLRDAYRHGEALGICVGDLAFFLAQELLSVDQAPSGFAALVAAELSGVALAQMQDVWSGAAPGLPSEEDILGMYAHKTGRYSFSLPLMAGAMLAGADEAQLSSLSELGEAMGVLFQIRDDELGVYGEESELGKPLGSDIREGKKTIFLRALADALPPEEGRRVASGAWDLGAGKEGLDRVRSLLESSGARARIASLVDALRSKASALIAGLGIDGSSKNGLSALLAFVLERGK